MDKRLVSEVIIPVISTCDTSRMAVGEPGLPREFLWRGRTIEISSVLRAWRETGNCRHGSSEQYVRNHCFEVVTISNDVMKIYFERQPRRGKKEPRWWLFSIRERKKEL
jgi:phosphoribosylglycinamide formyltransferase-1